MKVLSLLQPWASLVVMGEKRIETRSFNTKHRGPLLIHASLGKSKVAEHVWIEALQKFNVSPPTKGHYHFTELPFGAIIGSVNVVETHHSEYLTDGAKKSGMFSQVTEWETPEITLTDKDGAFGDYSPGRYGWLLKDPIMFPTPIPCKGDLGIRDILRPSAFAIVEEKVPYEKGVFGMLNTHYLTYYGQKVEGHICKEEADNALLTFFDHWKDSKADRSQMMGATRHWPRILEIEQQLFNPGVASVEQITDSMNC